MRIMTVLFASALASLPVCASAQSNPPHGSSGPLGGWQAPSNDPGSGAGDIPGASLGLPNLHPAQGGLKGSYGLDLSRRLADAQRVVDDAASGRALTDRDARRIRDLMREDFIAWNKQFDLRPSVYRAERARWLVESSALSPDGWARQRLDWLKAQRDWVVAHGG